MTKTSYQTASEAADPHMRLALTTSGIDADACAAAWARCEAALAECGWTLDELRDVATRCVLEGIS